MARSASRTRVSTLAHGLAIAVANARPEVKREAHFIATRHGGDGAVRELIEVILKAQGKWDAAAAHAKA